MRKERDPDIDMRRAIDAIKEKYEERERGRYVIIERTREIGVKRERKRYEERER